LTSRWDTSRTSYIFDFLKREYSEEIELLAIDLPVIDQIPQVKFRDAKELIAKEYNRRIKDPYDLEPEEEQLIGQYFKEHFNSDFVFVTHYPTKKRPFYAMDDPEDPRYTLSFDLLFRGLEVTTGGQRIHDYQQQVGKMIEKGLEPEEFASYLMMHRYGMPPHGGLGIGLERLSMKLFGDTNIRLSSMFPRDMGRLDP
jgi:nondiscriminating aspartyl-tRNA synthetase